MKGKAAKTVCSICLSLAAVTVTRPSFATLSFVAVHPETTEMGGVVVSCSDGLFEAQEFSLSNVLVLHAGVGAVVAQSVYHEEGRDELERLLVEGLDPHSAMDEVIDPAFDEDSSSRQYAVLDLLGAAFVHTGKDCPSVATHTMGKSADGYSYTLQGNTMAQAGLLDLMETGFLEESGSLPARLVRALERLASEGSGDVRCEPRTSDTGYFAWLSPDDGLIEVEISTWGDDRDAAQVLAGEVRSRIPGTEPPPETTGGKMSDPKTARSGCSWRFFTEPQPVSPLTLGVVLGAAIGRRRRRVGSIAHGCNDSHSRNASPR